MRIVSGTLKGRSIEPGSFFKDRPTTDMAKEALFNILIHRVNIDECSILDLFAGSGSISFEFVSRGAAGVTAVDQNLRYIRFIEETARKFSVSNLITIRADVFRFLNRLPLASDIVFADPPFDHKRLSELPYLVVENGWLKPDGFFILEHPGKENFDHSPYFVETRHYGKVHFSFFEQIPPSV
jgi:16S rRNA (guanine966-N2)-methyltransferase